MPDSARKRWAIDSWKNGSTADEPDYTEYFEFREAMEARKSALEAFGKRFFCWEAKGVGNGWEQDWKAVE